MHYKETSARVFIRDLMVKAKLAKRTEEKDDALSDTDKLISGLEAIPPLETGFKSPQKPLERCRVKHVDAMSHTQQHFYDHWN